jgi:hypothetical protein
MHFFYNISVICGVSYYINGNAIIQIMVYSNIVNLIPEFVDLFKPNAFTIPGNKRDIFASWHSDVSGGGVFVCRELLP